MHHRRRRNCWRQTSSCFGLDKKCRSRRWRILRRFPGRQLAISSVPKFLRLWRLSRSSLGHCTFRLGDCFLTLTPANSWISQNFVNSLHNVIRARALRPPPPLRQSGTGPGRRNVIQMPGLRRVVIFAVRVPTRRDCGEASPALRATSFLRPSST